jgi:hypothetical protein
LGKSGFFWEESRLHWEKSDFLGNIRFFGKNPIFWDDFFGKNQIWYKSDLMGKNPIWEKIRLGRKSNFFRKVGIF